MTDLPSNKDPSDGAEDEDDEVDEEGGESGYGCKTVMTSMTMTVIALMTMTMMLMISFFPFCSPFRVIFLISCFPAVPFPFLINIRINVLRRY